LKTNWQIQINTPSMKNIFTIFSMMLMAVVLTLPVSAQASWQKGSHMVHEYQGDPNVYASDAFKQSVRNLKETGTTDVPLVVHVAQSNKYSTDVRNGVDTPTDYALREGITYLQDQGFRVTLKVLLQPDDGTWRAMIKPYNREEWFANYEAKLLEYAQVAQDLGVYQYSIGTELLSMTTPATDASNTARWRSMIANVRNIYSGKLIYGAQHGYIYLGDYGVNVNELEGINFWDQLDYIGLSAYYPMSNERQPSVDTLLRRWQEIEQQDILPVQQRWGMQVLLAEVGYKSMDYTFVSPGEWQRSGAYNETNQANGYQALLQFFSGKDYFAGVHFWDWKSNPYSGGYGDIDYTIQGKQQTIDVLKSFEPGSSDNPTFEPTPVKPLSREFSGLVDSLSNIVVGQTRNISVSVTNDSDEGVLNNGVVDIEIFGPSGNRVAQYYYDNESFAEGEVKEYVNSLTFSQEGTYIVKLGVFTNGWRENLVWIDNLKEVPVTRQAVQPQPTPEPEPAPEPEPEPTPTPDPVEEDPSTDPVEPQEPAEDLVDESAAPEGRTVEIWWPTNGTPVSGSFPLKAILQDTPVDKYEMYWQVDGGVLNQMYDSYEEYPHKQSWIDVSGWRWQADNRYTLTFLARDKATGQEFRQSVVITVQN
jgi:hypothetical protein